MLITVEQIHLKPMSHGIIKDLSLSGGVTASGRFTPKNKRRLRKWLILICGMETKQQRQTE